MLFMKSYFAFDYEKENLSNSYAPLYSWFWCTSKHFVPLPKIVLRMLNRLESC